MRLHRDDFLCDQNGLADRTLRTVGQTGRGTGCLCALDRFRGVSVELTSGLLYPSVGERQRFRDRGTDQRGQIRAIVVIFTLILIINTQLCKLCIDLIHQSSNICLRQLLIQGVENSDSTLGGAARYLNSQVYFTRAGKLEIALLQVRISGSRAAYGAFHKQSSCKVAQIFAININRCIGSNQILANGIHIRLQSSQLLDILLRRFRKHTCRLVEQNGHCRDLFIGSEGIICREQFVQVSAEHANFFNKGFAVLVIIPQILAGVIVSVYQVSKLQTAFGIQAVRLDIINDRGKELFQLIILSCIVMQRAVRNHRLEDVQHRGVQHIHVRRHAVAAELCKRAVLLCCVVRQLFSQVQILLRIVHIGQCEAVSNLDALIIQLLNGSGSRAVREVIGITVYSIGIRHPFQTLIAGVVGICSQNAVFDADKIIVCIGFTNIYRRIVQQSAGRQDRLLLLGTVIVSDDGHQITYGIRLALGACDRGITRNGDHTALCIRSTVYSIIVRLRLIFVYRQQQLITVRKAFLGLICKAGISNRIRYGSVCDRICDVLDQSIWKIRRLGSEAVHIIGLAPLSLDLRDELAYSRANVIRSCILVQGHNPFLRIILHQFGRTDLVLNDLQYQSNLNIIHAQILLNRSRGNEQRICYGVGCAHERIAESRNMRIQICVIVGSHIRLDKSSTLFSGSPVSRRNSRKSRCQIAKDILHCHPKRIIGRILTLKIRIDQRVVQQIVFFDCLDIVIRSLKLALESCAVFKEILRFAGACKISRDIILQRKFSAVFSILLIQCIYGSNGIRAELHRSPAKVDTVCQQSQSRQRLYHNRQIVLLRADVIQVCNALLEPACSVHQSGLQICIHIDVQLIENHSGKGISIICIRAFLLGHSNCLFHLIADHDTCTDSSPCIIAIGRIALRRDGLRFGINADQIVILGGKLKGIISACKQSGRQEIHFRIGKIVVVICYDRAVCEGLVCRRGSQQRQSRHVGKQHSQHENERQASFSVR